MILTNELRRRLAMLESQYNPIATGDDGRSFGIYQLHATFRAQFAPPDAVTLYRIADDLTIDAYANKCATLDDFLSKFGARTREALLTNGY